MSSDKGEKRSFDKLRMSGSWGVAEDKNSPSTSSGRTDVGVGRNLIAALREEADRAFPKECCGLLLGYENTITAIQPAKNVHPTPHTHFEIDPQTLIDAHRDARNGGPDIVGYYHSHPNGHAEPSGTDRLLASGDGKVWAIVGGEQITLWRDTEAGFAPLSYLVKQA